MLIMFESVFILMNMIQIINSSQELFYECFDTLTFTEGNWISNTATFQIYQCSYGMSLVQLSPPQTLVSQSLSNLPPHYSIQLLIDIYAFHSIDGTESAIVTVDSQTLTYNSPGANGKVYFNQCGSSSTYKMEIKTFKLEQLHSSASLLIKIQTTTNQAWPDEGYLFRNLQVFYKKCYYTCKSCNSDTYNTCLTCFTTNTIPINGECQICINEINKKFLLITQGCLQECPTGYIYNQNSEFVCHQNSKLMSHQQLNYVLPQTIQDLTLTSTLSIATRNVISCSLTASLLPYYQNELLSKSLIFSSITTRIRLRATFTIFGIWISPYAIQILYDNVLIDFIRIAGITVIPTNSILLYTDQTIQTCLTYQYFNFRIELIQEIPSSNVQMQFQAINLIGMTEFWSVTQIDIEEQVCALNCQTCKNSLECQTCTSSFYLHKGECVSACPAYSTLIGTQCIDFDEEFINGIEYTRIDYLVKEFHDVSTTLDRINQLFTLQTASSNNFAKGSGIYFSYLPKKRVFGGALVWVDAIFNFNLILPQYYHQLRIRFQVILGDNFSGQFRYTINNGNQVIISTSSLSPILVSQLWGDSFQEHVFLIDETLSSQSLNGNLPIIFQCSNPGIPVNQAFCAIQNMFITAISCPAGFQIDQFRYDFGVQPCIAICGDGLIKGDEECDDGNNIPFDGCYNCRYSCEDQCQFCFQGQCLINQCDQDERFDIGVSNSCETHCNNGDILCQICGCLTKYQQFLEQYSQQTCQLECLNCHDGICTECQENYRLNIIQNTCDSICGDLIISGNEECDDGK